MKKSNIILSILVGSVTFVILAGAIQLRVTGKTRGEYSERKTIDTPLQPFKYVVFQNATNVTITTGDTPQLLVYVGQTDADPIVGYRQSGDTLFIDKITFGEYGKTLQARIKAPASSIEWIGARGSMFQLENYTSPELKVVLDNSRMSLSSDDNRNFGNIEVIETDNSNFHTENIVVDTAIVTLDGSNAWLNGTVRKLKGSARNGSTLGTEGAAEVEFTKDSSSNIN